MRVFHCSIGDIYFASRRSYEYHNYIGRSHLYHIGGGLMAVAISIGESLLLQVLYWYNRFS